MMDFVTFLGLWGFGLIVIVNSTTQTQKESDKRKKVDVKCGERVKMENDMVYSLTSPGYPKDYVANSSCHAFLTVPADVDTFSACDPFAKDVSGNSSNPGIPESSEYYNETIASSQYTGELLTGLTSPKGEKHVAEFKFEAGNSTGKGILCLVGINTKRATETEEATEENEEAEQRNSTT